METEILRGDGLGVSRAGEILRSGGVVAIPTETVYGLAADALNRSAVAKIFAAKERPADNPLIVHITELAQWEPLVQGIPEAALALAEAFWPGPLTIVLKKSAAVPMITSGGLDTVGVRCPSHPLARAVIDAAGRPLAAPSANRSGRPSPTTFAHTLEDLRSRVDGVLDGGDCQVGVESTVVSLCGDAPRLLRPGGITEEQLRGVLGRLEVDPAVTVGLAPGAVAASPGMKYQHYAPQARVELLDGSPEAFAQYVNRMDGAYALAYEETLPLLTVPALNLGSRFDRAAQARELFGALHRLDELGARQAFAPVPSRREVGLAVYNRLARAAAFRITPLPGPWIVGLVGPSGAGKSTVAAELARKGFAVIDCDRLTRSSDVYDRDCIEALRQAFGRSVARDMGSELVLDRQELARRAFRDEASTRLLNEITFPPIIRAIRREAARHSGPVLLDAPTLFEAGLDSMCARILAVTAPKEVRARRIAARDGLSGEQAAARFRVQKPSEFYEERADFVIENGGDGDLSAQLERACAAVAAPAAPARFLR